MGILLYLSGFDWVKNFNAQLFTVAHGIA